MNVSRRALNGKLRQLVVKIITAAKRLDHGLRKLDGQTGFRKNCKTPFF